MTVSDMAHSAPSDAVDAARALLKGVAPVSLSSPGIAPDDIECAWRGLARFRDEVPLEEQARWAVKVFRHPLLEHRVDDGVVRRDEGDRKYYLHYRPDLPELLAARGIVLTDWQEEWLASCDVIRTSCIGSVRALAREIDRLRPGLGLVKRLDAQPLLSVLRVLLYDPKPGLLAQAHRDICGISTHIGESHRGLFGESDGERRYLGNPKAGEVFAFPGEQLTSLTDGTVPALFHGVENVDGAGDSRWAIVNFNYF